MRGLLSLVVLIGLVPMGQAAAGETVECASRHFEYNECGAGPLRSPQLIRQSSSSACIVIVTGPLCVVDGIVTVVVS